MSIEAMKQALEALENNRQTHHYCEDTWYSCPKHEDGCANDSEGDECNCGADKANAEIDAAITSLRQAIAEAEKQEPVAWQVHPFDYGIGPEGVYARTDRQEQVEMWKRKGWDVQPLYTRPQPKREWVGLTDEEIQTVVNKVASGEYQYSDTFARAIEAKLKERTHDTIDTRSGAIGSRA